MHVLAVGNLYPPAAQGGYERIWVATMRALVDAGHQVTVLTTAPVPGAEVPAAVLEAERDATAPRVVRELDWWWRDFAWPRFGLRARRRAERHNARVLERELRGVDVVAWWAMGGMSLSLLDRVRAAGVPAVGVVGDAWMVYGPRVDAWQRLQRRLGPLGRPADIAAGARWLFISDWVRERSREAAGDLPRAEVVRPGVDGRFAERAPAAWAWRLACVGRVEPRKGVDVAIEALAQLPAEATLTVDGDAEPAYRAELEALAQRLGVAARVRFARSPSDRVAGAYAAADAVLFPVTWPEPWGLVPLEAMAVGRPVVATGTGGSGEYLADGDNALVVAPGDAAALAAAVRRLAEDGALRERLRAGGRATASRYTAAAFEAAVVRALEEEAAA